MTEPVTLQERLRYLRHRYGISHAACDEAADALDAKSALLAEAETALKRIAAQRTRLPMGSIYVCNTAIAALAKIKAANKEP